MLLQNEIGYVMSSKNKTPWMVYDGEEVADSHFCIKHLNRVRGVDLNSWLTEDQRAVARAFQMMTEDHLYWLVMTSWLGDGLRITGPLWGESTAPPFDSPHKGSVMKSFGVFLFLVWANCWVNIRVASHLRRHVTVMVYRCGEAEWYQHA